MDVAEWNAKINQALFTRWYVVADDLVGGWAITMVDQPLSEIMGKEPVLMDGIISFEVASYIVALHHHRLGIR